MANVAVLARLTAGSLWRDPNHISGGVPTLTGEEIRGALGGLSMLETRLALVMWCREDSEWRALERAALAEAAGLRRVVAWKGDHPPGLLRAFVAAALAEVTQPPVCRACRGAGTIRYMVDKRGKRIDALALKRYERERRMHQLREQVTMCLTCEGSGWKRMTDEELARFASLHYPMSRQTWGRLSKEYGYEDVYGWLKGRADAVERHIRIQLHA